MDFIYIECELFCEKFGGFLAENLKEVPKKARLEKTLYLTDKQGNGQSVNYYKYKTPTKLKYFFVVDRKLKTLLGL